VGIEQERVHSCFIYAVLVIAFLRHTGPGEVPSAGIHLVRSEAQAL